MKKIISLIVALAMTAMAMPFNSLAEETEYYGEGPVIEEPFEYADTAKSSLTISGSTATCKSTVDAIPSVTDIYINQTLYRYVSGRWVLYAHWSDHQYTNFGSLKNEAENIPSGSYYLHSNFTLYYPTGFEQFSVDSQIRP